MAQKHELDNLFAPHGIAVIGASDNPLKAGCIVINNMVGKYPGDLYPVNASVSTVAGLKAYAKLSEIEGIVEMVVLIMPASAIYAVMDDLDKRMAEKGDVKYIVCAAADYAETRSTEGIHRQARLLEAKERYGIRIVGPNCIGVIDNISHVNTTFVAAGVEEERFGSVGGISFVSQSGSVASSLLTAGASKVVGIRYNKFISIGNMADLDFLDLLSYLEQDESTRVIGLYMEGYSDGRRLVEAMGRIARKKPVVVLKVGRSSIGSMAANSHTGSLAGSDAVYDAAFRQYGIIRVQSIYELLDTLQTLDRMPVPCSGNMFVLTQAGGPGIFCTDELSKYPFIKMPVVSDQTKAALRACLPAMSAICIPEGYADITASASIEQHCNALTTVLKDDEVDSVCFITVVTPFLPAQALGKSLADAYWALEEKHRKPVFFCIMMGEIVNPVRRELELAGLCTFDTPVEAIGAAKNALLYAMGLRTLQEGI